MTKELTTEPADKLDDKLGAFVKILPQAQALGLSLVEAGPGHLTLCMPYAEKLIGDPLTRVVHGGAVSTLLDTCSGGAVISHPDMEEAHTATLGLRIDYMRAAPPGRNIYARAECYHVTRTVAFVRGQAWVEGEADRPVASAAGTFTATRRAAIEGQG